ncbi:MAG: class I SAM-dependent methyltransferase [Bacteroidota bacterium]|nr:class I SAM-dependent methyltransferase [Bacteroidota bacterium]
MMNSIKEKWKDIQDNFYSDPQKHTHLMYKPNSVYAKDLVNHLIYSIDISTDRTVLEIGAGAGRFSLHLLPHCRKLVALDSSISLLKILENNHMPNLEIICADVFDIPEILYLKNIDMVCGFFILHHLPKHENLFSILHKMLKPAGSIAFIEPNRINPLFLLQVMVSPEMSWKAEKGMFTFSISKTKNILEQAGFVNIKLKYFGLFPPAILDNFRFLYKFQTFLEHINYLNRLLPFVLITAQKE